MKQLAGLLNKKILTAHWYFIECLETDMSLSWINETGNIEIHMISSPFNTFSFMGIAFIAPTWYSTLAWLLFYMSEPKVLSSCIFITLATANVNTLEL
jgi:hypothetical protein